PLTSLVALVPVIAVLALGVGLSPTTGAAAAGDPVVGAWATYQWTSSVQEQVPIIIKQDRPGDQPTWTVATERTAPIPLFVTYSILRADANTYLLQIVTRQTMESVPLSVTQITVDRASGNPLKSVIQRPKGQIVTPESGLRPFRESAVRER